MPKFRYEVRYTNHEIYEVEAESADHVEYEVGNGNEGELVSGSRDGEPGEIIEIWEAEEDEC